ncbi:XrtA-associated tyrosine autokinase [Rubrivivax gelatinosus]|uniref:Chromosome partitioning ATPase n=1 Tax=Rubrivivax gelatinosus TaxID=28068 RepID=A0ABS1DY69_RUBGE|nr:XrtA-associated tyrosine autokinase [Rubrivivax gelatinosus]MBK1714319.1 chromosome partitioning ATPase [Rubrivivax gelatinosus]
MSSLIEQAARRLEQLRQAGVTVPEVDAAPTPAAPPAALPPAREPVATSRRVELDLDQLAAAGIVTPSAPRSTVADQFRVIKRPLIANAVGKGATTLTHGNLIMVTSAVAGEGKSFTSVNLAMSIAAELDHTVVLVDADVARPSMLRMLGLPPSAGLLDVLEGKAELADVLMRTNVDKLTLLPSGTPHPKATELLASDAMATLLDEMATRYPDRIVIFDSPPLLLTTESRVLASHMGQIVVVVAAGRTQQSAVQQALDTIDACPVRLLVLNKARSDSVGYGTQGYGYGYGYGHGEPYERSDGNTTEPAAPAAGRTEG